MGIDYYQIPAKGDVPHPRQAVSGTLVNENQFVVFGGGPVEGPYTNTIHILDLTSFVWSSPSSPNPPPPRGVMALASEGTKVYMFGGYSERHHLNDFYSFDIISNTWEKLSSEGGPSPRRGASMVVYNNKLYLYGGSDGRGMASFDEIYSYDIDNKSWTLEKKACVGSYRHSAVVYKDSMLIFGGDKTCGFSNQLYYLHTYNFISKEFKLVEIAAPPPPMEAHSAAVLGETMIIFGGLLGNGNFNDKIFNLDTKTNTWTPEVMIRN